MASDNNSAPTIDLTWIARIAFGGTRDRPSSTWLPPGQRLVGPRFNDPEKPEWMDEPEWRLRASMPEAPRLRAASTHLKLILCEGRSLSEPAELIRLAAP